MVKCDNCPCFNKDNPWCQLSNAPVFGEYGDGGGWTPKYYFPAINIGCPILEIKLKDGTTYRPEVVDDKN
jgi:hypothetical protein